MGETICSADQSRRPGTRPRRGQRSAFPAFAGERLYETFAGGNERFGRPHNPDFLLRPGELLDAFTTPTVVAFEQGEVSAPRPAVIQRIAAVAGPLGRLPEPNGVGHGSVTGVTLRHAEHR
jgi:hypothetical protein